MRKLSSEEVKVAFLLQDLGAILTPMAARAVGHAPLVVPPREAVIDYCRWCGGGIGRDVRRGEAYCTPECEQAERLESARS